MQVMPQGPLGVACAPDQAHRAAGDHAVQVGAPEGGAIGTNFDAVDLSNVPRPNPSGMFLEWPQRLPRRWGHFFRVRNAGSTSMPHYSFHFHGKQSVTNFFDETFPNDREATQCAE